MDLRQLRYFVHIAEAGNVRRAASRLRVAQPALSRHVKALEGELGVRLLERHPYGVSVTSAGSRLLNRARFILQEVEKTRSEVMAKGNQISGRVCFGTSGAMSRILFGRLAERVRAEAPGIMLDLIEGGAYHLLEGIDTRRIDLAMMARAEPRANFILEPLVADQVYLIGDRGDSRLPPARIGVREMEGLPLVAFKRPSGPRMIVEQAAAQLSVALTVAYEVESIDVIKNFVARGLGYGVLAYSCIFDDLKKGLFRAVEIDGLSLTRMLVRRADHAHSPVVDALARLVRREVAALRGEGLFG